MAGSSKAKTAAAAAGRATARMAKTGDVIPLADAKPSRKSKKDLPRVIYVGHVPHGFYETQMREYFGQFGDVTRVKVSRNKKTGRSKHYAFIEFKHPEVASIVAESMNNYLLANQVLKVTLIEPEKVHPKTFEGTGTKFKKVPWQRRAAAKHNKDRTDAEKAKRNKGLVKAEDKRRAAIAAAGIDYEFPGYKAILSTEKPKAKKASTPAKKASTPAKKASTPAKKASTPAKKASTPAKSLAKEKMTPKKTPAKVKKTPAKKDVESTEEKKKTPTPVARKTRGALKRTNETPAKPAKKAKQ
ncbi:Nucleotide-binding, alpha-beta plait [Ostreococcus tauri]|uniref:Nucleotide-binding, alpha-beta plait n=1 Tax=Ostreococcus tauri TaxID=70448 RepID=A0A090M5Q6_OSTTA|nr:Nucleotide-binding, alpha-beta plait [Ostreococcus tauri]CEF98007.1 Nucleotide-binding, alpha-beta plait [Ostreococcus tauri]|eukprot:XP_022839024.1 Nucleotide-binding, alpha-beta plait [Ostreococcus tauri]